MQLEIGKRYVTRDKQISDPVEARSDNDKFPFKAKIAGCRHLFRSDGQKWGRGKSRLDLVEEYVEPVEPVEPETPKPSKGRVYICGPMRGIPRYNFPAFDAASAHLQSAGFDVVNPAEIDREAGFDVYALPEDYDWHEFPTALGLREVVRRDVETLCGCDYIFTLPGSYRSVGAKAEMAVARWLGLPNLSFDY